MSNVEPIIDLLQQFIDEESIADLQRALELINVRTTPISELMEGLKGLSGDEALKKRATASVRSKMGLPVVPEPVLRTYWNHVR